MNEPGNGHPRDLLSEYLDDQLGVEARASIDRHLADCEDCRAELEALRRLSRAVADEEVPPVPLDLAARIARSLDAAKGMRPRGRRFVIPTTLAATLAAIGILVALQWREGRLGTPPASESRPESPVLDQRSPPKAPTPSTPPEADAVPSEEKKEDVRHDALERNLKASSVPTLEQSDKQKENGVPGGVVGGVVGGVAGGVEGGTGRPAEPPASADEERRERLRSLAKDSAAAPPPALRAKTAVVSPCVDRWSDSGLRGDWEVPDAAIAARELGRIADDVGGIGVWRGIADGRPYVLVVPRDRFEEVFYALRARGVTGFVTPPALDPGVNCAGISVALTVVAAAPSAAPR